MPKFLCLHILLTAAVAAFSSTLPDTLSAYATDNPENAVAVMTPEDRIKTYERLAKESDGADAERYIDMMMQAAKESGSHEKETDAMYLMTLFRYVEGSLNEFLDCAETLKPDLLEAMDDRYVFIEMFVIKRLLSEGRNETASREAREFLKLAGRNGKPYWEGYAYYGMGLTYMAGGYLDKSEEAMKRGYSILSREDKAGYAEKIRVAFDIIDLLIEKEDWRGALDYGDPQCISGILATMKRLCSMQGNVWKHIPQRVL